VIVTQTNFNNPTLLCWSNFFRGRFLFTTTTVLFVSSLLLSSFSSSSRGSSYYFFSSAITPSSSERTIMVVVVVVVSLLLVVIVVLVILSSTSLIITNNSLSSETKYDSGYSSYSFEFNTVSYFNNIFGIIVIITITCGGSSNFVVWYFHFIIFPTTLCTT